MKSEIKFKRRKMDELLEVLSGYESKQIVSNKTIYHLTTPSSYIQLGMVVNDKNGNPSGIIPNEYPNTQQKEFERALLPYLKIEQNGFSKIYDAIRNRISSYL